MHTLHGICDGLRLGRLGLELVGLNLEGLGQLTDNIETNRMRLVGVLGATDGVTMNAGAFGQLTLQEGSFGAPVAQCGHQHDRGAGRHGANGSRRLLRGCFGDARLPVDGAHVPIVGYPYAVCKTFTDDRDRVTKMSARRKRVLLQSGLFGSAAGELRRWTRNSK